MNWIQAWIVIELDLDRRLNWMQTWIGFKLELDPNFLQTVPPKLDLLYELGDEGPNCFFFQRSVTPLTPYQIVLLISVRISHAQVCDRIAVCGLARIRATGAAAPGCIGRSPAATPEVLNSFGSSIYHTLRSEFHTPFDRIREPRNSDLHIKIYPAPGKALLASHSDSRAVETSPRCSRDDRRSLLGSNSRLKVGTFFFSLS